MDDALIAIAVLAGIAGGAYALDRLGLWLEARGWLYYRTKRGSVPLGRAVLETQAVLDPSKRHVLETARTEPEGGESGDPPTRETGVRLSK
jgi:hypothetical protein